MKNFGGILAILFVLFMVAMVLGKLSADGVAVNP